MWAVEKRRGFQKRRQVEMRERCRKSERKSSLEIEFGPIRTKIEIGPDQTGMVRQNNTSTAGTRHKQPIQIEVDSSNGC